MTLWLQLPLAPLVQYAQQLIQAGELGTITHYHGRQRVRQQPARLPLLALLGEQAGTLATDVAGIDMALMLNGPVTPTGEQSRNVICQRLIPTPVPALL